ncbi:hypothetical protein [Catenulispora subtropica]|uniref:Uncharacterized protein n=1 Tax=Catenulispora subtropica TaxID=450798 RepID=A0ABP5BYR0_9ACTN
MTRNTTRARRFTAAGSAVNPGGKPGRSRTEYQTVNLGGRRLRVAKTLSERTNTRRGYCNSCSGNGCPDCAGKGRATGNRNGAARTSRTSRPATARTPRSAKRSKAKRPRRPGLLGLLGFRKRVPLRRRAKSWVRNLFGANTTASRRGGAARGGQVVAIGGNPGASWWRCPRCGAGEYALPDDDVATGRAARHVAETHPGMPFRLDPQ